MLNIMPASTDVHDPTHHAQQLNGVSCVLQAQAWAYHGHLLPRTLGADAVYPQASESLWGTLRDDGTFGTPEFLPLMYGWVVHPIQCTAGQHGTHREHPGGLVLCTSYITLSLIFYPRVYGTCCKMYDTKAMNSPNKVVYHSIASTAKEQHTTALSPMSLKVAAIFSQIFYAWVCPGSHHG
jgi:hypothetical protein